jgi:hypothetical protein
MSSSSIVAAGTATYTVTFTPTTSGAKSATVTASGTSVVSVTSAPTGTGTATVTPVIVSSVASSITAKSAQLNGSVTTLGICPATTEKGFVYCLNSVQATPTSGAANVTTTSVGTLATGTYLLALTGLPSSTQYNYRAYLFDGTTYTYGGVQTFTTSIALVISGATSHGTVCPNTAATPITYTITNNGNVSVSGVTATSSDAQFVVNHYCSCWYGNLYGYLYTKQWRF